MNGWSTAPWIDIAINDGPPTRITPDLPRDDLVAAGVGPGAGFTYSFEHPLWLDDVVSVTGPDGAAFRRRLDDASAARIVELTRYCDPATQTGLEIGPLDRPIVPRSRFRVYYLDQASREDLARRFSSQGVNQRGLVEPDFASGGAAFTDVVGALRFDYCLASHVVEHVPDMVGWLWEIWSVLRDGGALSLAVPHAEHTFDARRRLSSLAELADAYFARLKAPSPRQIIDAQLGSALFHEAPDMALAAFHAFHQANHARKTGLYVDLHCNTFTPESFAHLMACLDRCELLGFDMLSMGYRGGDEFTVHMRKRADKVLPDHIRP